MIQLEERLFINNEFRPAKSAASITVQNPYDGSIVTESVHCAGSSDVDDAVDAAMAALKTWKATRPTERSRLLNRLADLVDANKEELGILETLAMGAPKFIAEHGAHNLADSLRYFAGWTDKLAGEAHADAGDGAYRVVLHEPLGVCAGVGAWNGTLMFVGWKMAPAVAAGNTFIFKASEKSPLSILHLGKLVREAGFPPGVINLINGGAEAGSRLASHPNIAKISFTGSTETGRRVQVAAANSNFKRCTLELGGKSAAIVFPDADMDCVMDQLSDGFLINSTQVCAATTRLLVHKTVASHVVSGLRQRFKMALGKMGDPRDVSTMFGPIANREQFERILGFLDEARKNNIEVVTGGRQHGTHGLFVEPTILNNPGLDSSVYRDEIFGPVLCIRVFETEDEAIHLANASVYGLGASVFTSDMARGLRVGRQMEAGSVGINRGVVPDIRAPFGGVKQSGYGRESGREGIMAYLESKTLIIGSG